MRVKTASRIAGVPGQRSNSARSDVAAVSWSAALFAGYGGVSPSLKDLDWDDMILAGGAGIRYMVAPKERVALRLDVAKGQDDTMVYVSVGEAF